MEKTKAGKCHYHVVVVGYLDNIVIPYRSTGLSNILNAASEGSFDVVSKREERI